MDPLSQTNVSIFNDQEEEEEALSLLQNMIPPSRLQESAGRESCCIFRIPHTLVRANNKAYEPKIISIGPYHRFGDREQFKMMEEHKKRFLEFFISKTQEHGVSLSHLVDVVSGLEQKIRDSYSEYLDLTQQKLIKIMILDGCFILMLFLVVSRTIRYRNYDDPIFKLRWIIPTIRSDLLLLENQVPLFLLHEILNESKLAPSTSFNEIAFKFFKFSIKRSEEFWEKHKNLEARHLLDLIRKIFIPFQPPQYSSQTSSQGHCCINIAMNGSKERSRTETPKNTSCLNIMNCFKKKAASQISSSSSSPPRPFLKLIVSARKLQLRGIKFKKKETFDTPLEITLSKGVLEIPSLVFDDFLSSLLINFVALEQISVKCSTEITSYVAFMGCLISTEDDANFLNEKGIIENYFGTGEQVHLFFKNIGKDICFSMTKSFLAKEFEGVNEYTSKGYHVHWAGFKYTHFKSPWAFMSSFAALLLLLLTFAQSFFAVYAYFRPPRD